MRPTPTAVSADAPEAARLTDFRELLKPGIAAFVVVMAAASYLLGSDGTVDWRVMIGLMVGTGLTAGGAGALNHVAERDHDRKMTRTQSRPVVTGRISPVAGTLYGIGAAGIGAAILAMTTNPLTTGLALATVALYVVVYTPLKRRTVHNTLIGAVPGALPALGGVTAATGTLDATGWTLFAILYLWQLPHFYALAWLLRDDYKAGGFAMLPNRPRGARSIARISLGATMLLLVAAMVPGALGAAGMIYLIGVAILGLGFTIPAFSFNAAPTDERAKRLFLSSVFWVPGFFALVVLDVLLR
ncbi:MAG: heme o synthase [Bacteroidota bacterium]